MGFRRRRRAVVEVRQGHARNRLAQRALDGPEVSLVFGCDERDGLAGGFHAGRPPDPVHVVGRDRRHVVVDHVRDAFDVDSARRDVRGDQDLVPPASESREGGLPLALAAIPMDSRDVETRLADLPGHAVRASLRADKDEDGQHVLSPEETDKEGRLEVLRDGIDLMADCRRGPVGRRHRNADGIAHDRPGERLDFRRHRRGEEEGLSLPREGVDDPADVREEAHVEHPVGLVEDEDLEAAEVDVAAGHVVQKPAWRRDDDIDPCTEGVLLRRHADAPVDRVAADAGALREAAESDLDLRRELPSRREDEGPRATGGLLQESVEDRQEEGRRLPRTGLGRPDHVASGQDRGDRFFLDRRRGFVSEAVHGSEENRFEAEMVERVLGVRCLHRGSYGLIGLRIRVDNDRKERRVTLSDAFRMRRSGVNMLYMTSFNVKEGRVRKFQTWVKKKEDVMQKSAPRGWTYRGTYGYVLGFGRYGGAQLWECNKYGDFDAWREHSDPGWTRIAEEFDGFLSEQPGESVLLREMGDVKVIEAKKPKK